MFSLEFAIAKHRVLRRKQGVGVNVHNQPLEPSCLREGHVHFAEPNAWNSDSAKPVIASNHVVPSIVDCCVVDTACQRSAIGANVLARIMEHLPSSMKIRYEKQSFKFKGVGSVTCTHEVAVIPVCLGTRPALIRAAILHEPADAPLLFSLPIMKALGAQIDLSNDQMHLRSIDASADIQFKQRGQLCIRLFDFHAVQQTLHPDHPWKPKKLIGDECTVFYQVDSGCSTTPVLMQDTMLNASKDVTCRSFEPDHSQNHGTCMVAHCSSEDHPPNSISQADQLHDGDRRISQEVLCQPRADHERATCSGLGSFVPSLANERVLDEPLCGFESTHDSHDEPMELPSDANHASGGCRYSGRHVRFD